MKAIQGYLLKFKWSLIYLGTLPTMVATSAKLLAVFGCDLTQREWYWRRMNRSFDKRFGVETTQQVSVDDLDVDASRKSEIEPYEATNPTEFGCALSRLEINYEDYAFVDFGSGKGRVVLMAAAFPFQKIIGVELSTRLYEAARFNMESHLTARAIRRGDRRDTRPTPPIQLWNLSAETVRLPVTPLVLYFFNPFKRDVMNNVLNRIRSSYENNPRHIVIVYHNPEQRDVFDEADFLECTRTDTGVWTWLIYEARPVPDCGSIEMQVLKSVQDIRNDIALTDSASTAKHVADSGSAQLIKEET